MKYSTLERQIMHSRRGVKQHRGTDSEEYAQGMLNRLEKRYVAEGNDISKLGKAQLEEAWRQIVKEEVKYVRVYSPILDDEIVLSRFSQMNWEEKTKIYSKGEIELLKGMDNDMLKMIHLIKSEIPGVEVIEVVRPS